MGLVAPFPVWRLLSRFVNVYTGGTVTANGAYYSLGFAPGFDPVKFGIKSSPAQCRGASHKEAENG